MLSIESAIFIAWALAIVIFDWRRRLIPNALIIVGASCALAFAAAHISPFDTSIGIALIGLAYGPDGPDGAPISVFESGAILLYLAAKTGRFLPVDVRGRYATLEWLMFQMGSIGPLLGQAHHFRQYAPEKIPYAIDRYTNEAKRLYGVLDTRVAKTRYVAGHEYTIADIAIFPWLRSWKNQGIDWNDYPHLKGWFDEINGGDKYEFVTPPTHLENLGNFVDQIAIKNFQEVLLGQKTAKEVADEWAAYLTKEQQDWIAANKK